MLRGDGLDRPDCRQCLVDVSLVVVMSFPKTPALVTDCAVFDMNGRVLLVRRGSEPFKGRYALPGGFIHVVETVEAACAREVEEETGVSISDRTLLLVGVYSEPDRDPRGHSVSIAYTTRIDTSVQPKPGSDAESAEWIRDWSALSLSFNHAEIIAADPNPLGLGCGR